MKLVHCFFSLFFLFIAGCATQHAASTIPPIPLSATCQKHARIDTLQQGGVQVIQVGDELRLILPTHRFFIKNTPVLQATTYSTLNEMVALLNQQKNRGIQVLAYTISLEDFKPNSSLEQQQAQRLVDYFLQRGLNTRLIIANAWKGVTARQKQGTGRFSEDAPVLFSVEVRTRLLQPEAIQ